MPKLVGDTQEEAEAKLDALDLTCLLYTSHASLLPRYRGAAPIQWAVIDGEAVSGVTTMLMDEGHFRCV